jgi:acyl carrier protein
VGLEVVEIVMDVEKTFGVSLPDARVSEIRTVGELHECVVETLGQDLDQTSIKQVVLDKLCDVISRDGESRNGEQVLSSLFPYAGRPAAWMRFEKSLGWPLPPLERPRLVKRLLIGLAVLIGWVAGLAAMVIFLPPDPPGWLAAPLGILFSLVAIYLSWRFGCWLTLPLARCWPQGLETLGNLADFIVRQHYGTVVKKEQGFIGGQEDNVVPSFSRAPEGSGPLRSPCDIASPRHYSRDEVWCILQGIVTEVLGIDREQVTPVARFVEDLGAG